MRITFFVVTYTNKCHSTCTSSRIGTHGGPDSVNDDPITHTASLSTANARYNFECFDPHTFPVPCFLVSVSLHFEWVTLSIHDIHLPPYQTPICDVSSSHCRSAPLLALFAKQWSRSRCAHNNRTLDLHRGHRSGSAFKLPSNVCLRHTKRYHCR